MPTAISISYGTCKADPRKLDKSSDFTIQSSANVYMKEDSSLMNPVFILSSSIINIVNVNYLEVPSWGRYYFVDDIIVMTGQQVALKCHEDVLMSNAAAIGDLLCYLDRTEKDADADKYMPDSAVPAECRRKCITLDFDVTPFRANYGSDTVYVLTVLGGSSNT